MTTTVVPQDYVLPEPLIIALANLKGGVGKTTSTFFLACFFALVMELRVLVIDADPLSQTGSSWYRRLIKARVKVPFTLISFPSPRIADCIEDNRDDFDVILVDVGGETEAILKAVVPELDELLLVTSVSPSEVKRVPSTRRAAVSAIREAVEADPTWVPKDPRVRVLMTKVPVTVKKGVNVSLEYREQRTNLEDAGYPVMENYARSWKWYREAADGEVGKGAENPIEDIGEYKQIGLELVAPYHVNAGKEAVNA